LIGLRGGAGTIPYSRFVALLRADRVVRVEIGTQHVTGVYRRGGARVEFTTTRPPGVDAPTLLRELTTHHVEFTGTQPSGTGQFLRGLLAWLLPVALIVVVWMILLRRVSGGAAGAMSLGKSQHKVVDRRDLLTTFKDVAGLDEPVEELREVVDFLRDPRRYQRLGGRIPKGVLLVGPPGTGKTLLARAVAGEAAVPFFYLSGSNFVQMFVGLGAARVRDLFEQAKAKAPCIVFIDELDTIGRSRAGAITGTGSHEEREQTLNQLLPEMDGFDPSRGVIIMAATNRPEVLDPALLRPGRFDRQIVADLPDRRGRAAILRIHTRGMPLAPTSTSTCSRAAPRGPPVPSWPTSSTKRRCSPRAAASRRWGWTNSKRPSTACRWGSSDAPGCSASVSGSGSPTTSSGTRSPRSPARTPTPFAASPSCPAASPRSASPSRCPPRTAT
jgi:cell division protease FtsH